MSNKPSALQSLQSAIVKIDLSTLTLLGLGTVSGIVAAVIAANIFAHFRTYSFTIGAGGSKGESYIISTALAKVVQQHNPRIHLTVKETEGTTENLKLLESKTIALATAQADVPAGNSARIIANLYSDKFHLLAKAKSKVQQFSDLQGKRIALTQKGGQFQSFLEVAEHFGLTAKDFQFVGTTDTEADRDFINGTADAAFRVRAASNKSIRELAQGGDVTFVPIDQAAAMQIKHPALQPSTIPKGTYQGTPPLPSGDLDTVAVDRILLVHDRVPDEVVYEITQLLMNYRQEIADAIPESNAEVKSLVANFQQPQQGSGLGIPLHPGAQAFYDRDKPSFIQEHSDFVGLILTVILLMGSWVIELKRMIEARQKNQADEYSDRVIHFLETAQNSQTLKELDQIRHGLLDLLTKVVHDLDQDRISEESFQSFRVVWQIALDVTRERQSLLQKKIQ